MAGIKAHWWKWYPAEYLAAVNTLDLEMQGAWMRCISHGQTNGDNPGVMCANLAWVSADFRHTTAKSWELLLRLAMLRMGNLEVNRGEGFEVVDEAWAAGHSRTEKPEDFWTVKMTCRRVVRDAIQREKELARKITNTEDGPSSGDNTRKMGHLPDDKTKKGAIFLARAEPEPEPEPESNPPPPFANTESTRRRGSKPRKNSKLARVSENTPLMVRIGAWFGRQATTLWTLEEDKRLTETNPKPDELDLLEAYYHSQHPEIAPYRRGKLETLLNNWTGDLDMARMKLARYGAGAATSASRQCEYFDGKVE
jgi:hypothetical protein